MLLYKKLGLFEAFGEKCDRCQHRPRWWLYFNSEKTNFAFLCESCLRTLQAQRVLSEDEQEFVLKVKIAGANSFEVI